ncbi:longitudinals lacking protein, isoforms A/B/D/L-like isoform X2 [Anopheles moucheti]|uniref:longitudinals lacking protein, isoforms A/B/D/L-like isoform X2 n=1 Tax=Anopheles moucheti TaxID=186751 RepID=UPI0022F0C9DF|nr:longitudinals lacking protein, isoforms A/B/D/L-like isoform X2 [Anopheles moucheti]
MDDDQQFCLRWNNHQSTLISVFDTLLENGTLVDCTLAAEGKFLKAHKVVLSACSPYFATLLSQQYDKHPIFILKDVKFQELRAMMDYMYRGEVNISQDQLAALLKAAESLQIKGLSDNRSSSSSGTGGSGVHQQQQQKQGDAPAAKSLQPPVPASKASSGLTIENKRSLKSELLESDMSGSREGSSSPTSRKRKKVRRRSVDTNNLIDNHDQHSNSSSHSMHTGSGANVAALAVTGTNSANVAASSLSSSTAAAGSNSSANVLSVAAVAAVAALKKTETVQQAAAETLKLQKQQQAAAAAAAAAQSSDDDERCGGPGSVATGTEHDDGNDLSDNEHDGDGGSSVKSGSRHHHLLDGSRRGKTSTSSMGEMMIEPKSEYEDVQDENVEDLTMDDEDLMDELDQPGPSHGGDVSSQGYAQWPMDREQNESFIAQDAVGGQHRDAQDILPIKTTTGTTIAKGNVTLSPGTVAGTAMVGKRVTAGNGASPAGTVAGTSIVSAAGTIVTTPVAIHKLDASSNELIVPTVLKSDGGGVRKVVPHGMLSAPSKPLSHPRIKYSRVKNPYSSTPAAITSSTITMPILTIPTVTPSHANAGTNATVQLQEVPQQIVPSTTTTTTTVAGTERQLLNFSLSRKLPQSQQHVTITGAGTPGLTAINASAIQQIPIAAISASARGSSVTTRYTVNEYETSGSNTSQSADFPPGMIDDLDYSVIEDIDLSDGVSANFSNVVAAAAAAAGTTLTSSGQQQQQQQQQTTPSTIGLVTGGGSKMSSDVDNNGSQSDDDDQDMMDEGGDDGSGDDDDDEHITKYSTKMLKLKKDSGQPGGAKLLNASAGDSKFALLANPNIMRNFEYTVNESTVVSDTDDGEVRQYVCRHCGKRYRWKSTLRRHENVECGGKEASHQCPYCSYKAKQRGNLGVHIRKHHAEMPQLESRRRSNKSRHSM